MHVIVDTAISQLVTTYDVETLLSLLHSQQDEIFYCDDLRLDRLVSSLLELDAEDACRVEALAGDVDTMPGRNAAGFFDVLCQTICELGLASFFSRTGGGELHRSICPSAYDEVTGCHVPLEMAQWRANFRKLAPEKQMICATLIWLYRGGSDSTWLRRVPSNWRAREALFYMRDAGRLGLWLKLIARYPGW